MLLFSRSPVKETRIPQLIDEVLTYIRLGVAKLFPEFSDYLDVSRIIRQKWLETQSALGISEYTIENIESYDHDLKLLLARLTTIREVLASQPIPLLDEKLDMLIEALTSEINSTPLLVCKIP